MLNSQMNAVETELHPQAEKAIKQRVSDFSIALILQSKLVAYRSKADLVLSTHVDEALDTINKDTNRSWSRELTIILGSALLGAFVQGFVSELSSGNPLLIATYVALGFIGMFLVFWGLRR